MENTSVATQRVEWIDFMRVVACFMVVISHSCDFFVGMMDASPISFLSGAAWGSAVRASVPLFVIISGALLLPMKDTTSVFYKKRMTRVVYPFIVWCILTPFAYYAYGMISLEKALTYVYTFPIGFNMTTTPLWYIYMLIGLYLFIPVISPWIASVSKKGLEGFLKIWFVTLFLPYIKFFAPLAGYEGNYGSMDILGACDWNGIGMLYYFSGFLGYLVLGHYLVKYPVKWGWAKTWAVSIPLFIAGFCITYFGFISVTKNYAVLEIIWYFTNINVFMMVIALFLILRKVKIKNPNAVQFIRKLSFLSFGIYLTHFLFVQMTYDWTKSIELAPYLKIPMNAVIAFFITTLFVYILSKLPKSKYLIG